MTVTVDQYAEAAIDQPPPHLLIVDDARDNAYLLCQLLDLHGYTTSVAYNGQSALKQIAQQTPDLVLLDVMLPDIDGYEVTRRIRADQHLPFIPIILMTAASAIPDTRAAFDAGADDVLTKPINRHNLMARVRALLYLKQLQDELRANYARLHEVEHAREQMLGLLVHDLRTPLAGAISCLELLSRAPAQSDDERELITLALEACHSQNVMISDLLDLQRAEAGKLALSLEQLDLTTLVQAAVAQVAERVRQKQIMLQVVLPTRLPINGDAALLQRLLVNLLHNALKYSSKHGIILIAGHYDPVAACLQLSIEDNGYTLPADMLPHVFDRCHQPAEAAHSARRSIGVSLAFCHAVVALHGGAVWAEAPLRGLRVVCSLPTQLRASDASEGGV